MKAHSERTSEGISYDSTTEHERRFIRSAKEDADADANAGAADEAGAEVGAAGEQRERECAHINQTPIENQTQCAHASEIRMKK